MSAPSAESSSDVMRAVSDDIVLSARDEAAAGDHLPAEGDEVRMNGDSRTNGDVYTKSEARPGSDARSSAPGRANGDARTNGNGHGQVRSSGDVWTKSEARPNGDSRGSADSRDSRDSGDTRPVGRVRKPVVAPPLFSDEEELPEPRRRPAPADDGEISTRTMSAILDEDDGPSTGTMAAITDDVLPETAVGVPDEAEPVRARRYMEVGGTIAPLDEGLADSGYGYERYTRLAGSLTRPRWDEPYTVQYKGIHHNKKEWVATRLIALLLVALDLRFIYWLIFESHYPHLGNWLWDTGFHAAGTDAYIALRAGMTFGSIIMQLFLLMNVLTVSRACLAARDPIPVEPDTRLRVAFLTTIVPDKEPIEMAERTMRAAKAIVYDGKLDLWLLDEGNSDEVKEMCKRLGVRHFSRKGRGYLQFDSGLFANKTKHGNHNRWLWEYAGDYDVVMFVDTDHVPLPIMAERLLGYFRDPEVAFVVGPQFYGNTETRITRWAESAQYLFHSVIQRAGNRRRCAMLVGTNAAVRTSAIRAGYVDSVTEDMATSLKIHTTKSAVTGRPWRSVYTPDLVAVGEGPRTWTEFFGQQTRWSAGTYDAVLRQVWRVMFRLRPGAMLHYFLMLTYYPSVAIGWILGILISACYLGFGISALRTNSGWWLTYYVDVAAMQFLLYRFMRRHNVSPHEPAGSSGLSGMLVSALTAPIYARSLIKVIFRRKLTFNVTAKGTSIPQDRLKTFRYSLIWSVVPIAILIVAVREHRPYPMMMVWTALILCVCLAPIVVWQIDTRFASRGRKRRARAPLAQAAEAAKDPGLTSANR
jgi:cellulose synthase/poly-beta-1,6-N-acetylglucosamine synthase-like glycosyltransferase